MVAHIQDMQKIFDAYPEFGFEGELSKVQLEKLRQELKPHVDTSLDSIILFKSRQERWLDKEFWGIEDDKTSFLI